MKKVVFWDVTRMVLVRTDVSEERIVSIIRAERIRELGTSAVTISCTPKVACVQRKIEECYGSIRNVSPIPKSSIS
jgi:hypothetical protein